MDKYRSRKFLITLLGMGVGVVMAYFNRLSPELANIMLACIASYNIANAWTTPKNG